jgi:hypothetical protein
LLPSAGPRGDPLPRNVARCRPVSKPSITHRSHQPGACTTVPPTTPQWQSPHDRRGRSTHGRWSNNRPDPEMPMVKTRSRARTMFLHRTPAPSRAGPPYVQRHPYSRSMSDADLSVTFGWGHARDMPCVWDRTADPRAPT